MATTNQNSSHNSEEFAFVHPWEFGFIFPLDCPDSGISCLPIAFVLGCSQFTPTACTTQHCFPRLLLAPAVPFGADSGFHSVQLPAGAHVPHLQCISSFAQEHVMGEINSLLLIRSASHFPLG
jgi:hypothetical protein